MASSTHPHLPSRGLINSPHNTISHPVLCACPSLPVRSIAPITLGTGELRCAPHRCTEAGCKFNELVGWPCRSPSSLHRLQPFPAASLSAACLGWRIVDYRWDGVRVRPCGDPGGATPGIGTQRPERYAASSQLVMHCGDRKKCRSDHDQSQWVCSISTKLG